MVSDGQRSPANERYPVWLSLLIVAGGVVSGAVGAFFIAFVSWAVFGTESLHPNPAWGVLLRVASAVVLGVGIAAPAGPVHRTRIAIGLMLAAVWLVVLWQISPPLHH